MKRWLLLLMALSHAVAAQSSWGGGVDPLHMWNAHIVFSETHTLHFQLEVLADQDLPGGKSMNAFRSPIGDMTNPERSGYGISPFRPLLL
jgi:hypothetical protein